MTQDLMKRKICFGQKQQTQLHIWRILRLGKAVFGRRSACFMEKIHRIQIIYKDFGN